MAVQVRLQQLRWMWLVASLTSFACSRPAAQAPPLAKVNVVQPIEREVTEWDEYTARLEALETVEVRSRVSGYLQSIHFQDGASVKKGDLLFVIDPRPNEAALHRAEADVTLARSRVQLAQANYARVQSVQSTRAVSQEEAEIRESSVRQAEASAEQAQAALDAAKLDVEFTRVIAPISGRASRKLVTEGNLINGGIGTQSTLLTTIVTLDPIYAYFEADERSYLKYSRLALAGQRKSSRDYKNPVHVALADDEGFPREGFMDFVDNQFDRGTGTLNARAILPNPDLTLVPGLFARLRLPGSGKYRAMLIPDEAIGSDQAKKFVFVVNDQATTEYRAVKTGPLLDGLRVIQEGIAKQDWVVVGGTQRARPGLKVDAQRRTIEERPGTQDSAASSRASSVPVAPPGTSR